jgi:hypothetical protein
MRVRSWMTLYVVLLLIGLLTAAYTSPVQAQTQPGTPVPLPAPNALLIYDKTTVALINTSPAPLSLVGVSFMRAGGSVKFNAQTMINSLAPGHCIQVWTSAVRQVIGQPPECTTRDRWQTLPRKETYFWIADYENEPFRPQLRGSALTICKASSGDVGRCAFYIPQGDDAKKPWTVLDPVSGLPMPAGIQVAYDANQLWIGNLTSDTVLPTAALRLIYPVNGKPVLWTPGNSTWDSGPWDGRGLGAGQCIVLYADASKITPLLPCTPVGRAVLSDQPWLTRFDVMGPREERRATCGGDKPPTGPVLCIVGG